MAEKQALSGEDQWASNLQKSCSSPYLCPLSVHMTSHTFQAFPLFILQAIKPGEAWVRGQLSQVTHLRYDI